MGRVSAIAFRVRITVKIGVRVYTTLAAMQSLHALGNLCVSVCVHGCMYLYNSFVFACAHVYLHFMFYSCMYNISISISISILECTRARALGNKPNEALL